MRRDVRPSHGMKGVEEVARMFYRLIALWDRHRVMMTGVFIVSALGVAACVLEHLAGGSP